MNIETTSTPTMSGVSRRFGRRTLLATLGGSVILVTAVGAGLWARSGSGESSSPAVQAVAAQASLNSAVAPAAASHTRYTVYVVGSEEEAASVEAGIDYGNSILAANGEPPFSYSVFLAEPGEQASHVRFSLGYPEDTVVIDLRGK